MRRIGRSYGHSRSIDIRQCILVGTFLLSSHAYRSIPPAHMSTVLPPTLARRDDANSSLPLIITNNCSENIWPGISTQYGNSPDQHGFVLEPGESKQLRIADDWQGRVWGRTNCTFPDNNVTRKACATGDCNGKLDCLVSGDPPVTLAEMTNRGHENQAYYDISIVDGYNLAMAIRVLRNGLPDSDRLLPNNTNPSCVGSLSSFISDFKPYANASSFLGTNHTFPMRLASAVSSKQVSRWCPWDLQASPPTKPGDGIYAYPDDKIQRPIFQPCYSACAKYNDPADCCANQYDGPNRCKPSLYSKAAKRICPDAYSFAYDDQKSTFAVPTGVGFEVIFCPPGRSTSILNDREAKTIAVRSVVKDKQSQAPKESASLEKPLVFAAITLVITASVFSCL